MFSHHRTVHTGILSNALERCGEGGGHDVGANQLFAGEVGRSPLFQGGSQVGEGGATAGDDALLNGRLGGVDGIFQAQLFVLHLGFGGGTHLDHGHATAQLGEALLQLLLVVGGIGFLHLLADLLNPGLHRQLVAFGHDGGAVFGDGDATGGAQHLQLGIVQLQAGIFGDQLTVGEHGDVFQHGLAAIAEARGLHGGHVEHTAQAVHHQGGEGFFFDVLGDDQQGLAGAGDLLEHGHQILHQTDLLIGEQDVGIIQHRFHPLGVGGEVGRDVALVKAHAFGDLQFGGHRFPFFQGDHAFLANFVHGIGDHATHLFVVAGGDGAHLGDRIAVADRLGMLFDLLDQKIGRLVDAALEGDGVGAGGHVAQASLHHGVGQHGGGGGAVTSSVVGFGSGLTNQGHTGVLDVIFQLDLLGDRDAVVDDLGGAEFLLQHHIAALGTEGDGYGFGKNIDAFFEGPTGLLVINNALGHGRRTGWGRES